MAKLYLSRLILNTRSARVQLANARASEMHKLLMTAFRGLDSDTARRDVGLLYRLEGGGASEEQVLLVQSHAEPCWDAPSEAELVVNGGVDVKEIGSIFGVMSEGRMLRFRVLLNARSRINISADIRGTNKINLDVPDLVDWFGRRRGTLGFALSKGGGGEVQLDVSRRQLVSRGYNLDDAIMGCMVDGVLSITDNEVFERTVREGVGRARTYGFGLLSLMPVR